MPNKITAHNAGCPPNAARAFPTEFEAHRSDLTPRSLARGGSLVAWVRDLPNRIVTDADAAIASVGVAVTDYYHHCLDSGDSTTRLQIINQQFIPMIHGHPEVVTWIRNEYRDDIRTLIDSDDATLSAAASELMARLDAASESPRP